MKGLDHVAKTNEDGTPKTSIPRGTARVTIQTAKLLAKAVSRKTKGK